MSSMAVKLGFARHTNLWWSHRPPSRRHPISGIYKRMSLRSYERIDRPLQSSPVMGCTLTCLHLADSATLLGSAADGTCLCMFTQDYETPIEYHFSWQRPYPCHSNPPTSLTSTCINHLVPSPGVHGVNRARYGYVVNIFCLQSTRSRTRSTAGIDLRVGGLNDAFNQRG